MEGPFAETWFHAPVRSVGEKAMLSRDEAFHMRKVLRLQAGRPVVISNGEGGVFLCETRFLDDTVELLAVESRSGAAPAPRIHVVLGLLKGRDSEEPVEGICQLPVRAVHLVTTDHTQEFKGQDHSRMLERLKVKSLAALKQAKKPWLTEVHAPLPLQEWRLRHAGADLILAHPGPDRLPSRTDGDLYLLTGPEGGFSGEELDGLLREGAYTLGLGETRIRAAHAPLLAYGKLMGLGLA